MARTKTARVKPTLVGGLDYQDQFRAMIADPPEYSVSLMVTPELARFILAEYNVNNRPIRTHRISELCDEMNAGRWVNTRVPLIFNEDAHLIDGQHRLRAVAQFGAPVRMDVVFRADPKAFAFIDRGAKRHASDILAIDGIANSQTVAAAIQWIAQYDRGDLNANTRKRTPLKPDQVLEKYHELPRIQESVDPGRAVAKTRLAPASIATAMHYICAQQSRTDADEFFSRVADGVALSGNDDPAFKLRTSLIINLGKVGDAKLHPVRVAAYFIKAWNAYRKGEELRHLKLADDEAFPKAI